MAAKKIVRVPIIEPPLHPDVAWALGHFIVCFSLLDTTIEVAIGRLLKLDPVKSTIVTAGLQFKAKLMLLSSLLNLDPKTHAKLITEIKDLSGKTDRNDIVHSVVATYGRNIEFLRRRVDLKFKARDIKHTPETLIELAADITQTGANIMKELNFTRHDLGLFLDTAHRDFIKES